MVLRAFLADLCCRRFVLTVLADTAHLLPIQKMVKFTRHSHHVFTTKQKISWQELQGLHVMKKIFLKFQLKSKPGLSCSA